MNRSHRGAIPCFCGERTGQPSMAAHTIRIVKFWRSTKRVPARRGWGLPLTEIGQH
jgi:hypothetical protein